MLIQIHMLQNYAPSNLNRDDTGSPKDAIFGGYRRGRISSQCLKRSIRRSSIFEEAFEKAGLLGMRTRLLPVKLEEALKKVGADEAALKAIMPRINEIGRESAKAKEVQDEDEEEGEISETAGQTKQLIFLSLNELIPMAEKLLSTYKKLGTDKWKAAKIKDITKELGHTLPKSVDIAMFGRMTTSEAFEDVQASVQVAHAISTNTLQEEFDYFTAVDDLSGETGAGMIGDVAYNSSCYYKYLNIHWEELVKNLCGDKEVARQAVLALIEAAAVAQPTGKQNTFAAYNLPDFVLLEVSGRNVPVSYANAFIKPVRNAKDKSLVQSSIEALSDHMKKITTMYNLEADRAFISTEENVAIEAKDLKNLKDLSAWVEKHLPTG